MQLDTCNDGSGLFSVATEYRGTTIMFHVSTLLQYDETDLQRVQRKRFIGNDIVVIVFKDGPRGAPYEADWMTSQYTNVLAVVEADDAADPGAYRLCMGVKKGLREFGPPHGVRYARDADFIDLLLAKCLNGEVATKVSPEFTIRARRTRRELLSQVDGVDIKKARKKTKRNSIQLNAFMRGGGNSSAVPDSGASLWDIAFGPPQVFRVDTAIEVEGVVEVLSADFDAARRRAFVALPGQLLVTRHAEGESEVLSAVESVVRVEYCPALDFLIVLSHDPGRLFLISMTGNTVAVPALSVSAFCFEVVATGDAFRLIVACEHCVEVYVSGADLNVVREQVVPVPLVGSTPLLAFVPGGFVVGSTLRDLGTFTYFPWEGLVPITLFEMAQPVRAVFDHRRGVLLCFDDCGVLLRGTGKADITLALDWTGNPLHFAVLDDQFLVVAYAAMLEIRSLASGAVIETHILRVVGPVACPPNSVVVPVEDVAGRTRLAVLRPIGSDALASVTLQGNGGDKRDGGGPSPASPGSGHLTLPPGLVTQQPSGFDGSVGSMDERMLASSLSSDIDASSEFDGSLGVATSAP